MWRKLKIGSVSYNTATHQDNFKHKKKNGNDHRNGVQANIREGLVPDQTQLFGLQKLIVQMSNNAEEVVPRNHPRCSEEDFNASQLLRIVESK